MLLASLIERDAKPRHPSGTPPRYAQEDHRLIARVLKADPAAESDFIGRYDRFIYAILYRHFPDADSQEREDLRQQTYVLLWENSRRRLRQWQGAGGAPFSAYLGTIVRRLILDYLRVGGRSATRRRELASLRRPDPLPPQSEDSPESWRSEAADDPQRILEVRERRAALTTALAAALRQLSERDGSLIRQKHLQDRTYREIADALGMTVNHVGVALSRAEARLRRLLSDKSSEIFPESREPRPDGVINCPCVPSSSRIRPAAVKKARQREGDRPMQAISFTLQSGVTAEEKEKTLAAIRGTEGVVSAALLLLDDDPDIALMGCACVMGYAYVRAATDATATVARLCAIPGVASASVPGDRYLR